MVFYCECAGGFSHDVGQKMEGYFDALVRMCDRALKITVSLPLSRYKPTFCSGSVSFEGSAGLLVTGFRCYGPIAGRRMAFDG